MDGARGIHACTWTKLPQTSARDVLRTYVGLLLLLHLVVHAEGSSVAKPCEEACYSGKCVNGSCACDYGWVGEQCQHCQGRFK